MADRGNRYIDDKRTGRVGWISAFRSLRDFNDSDYAGDIGTNKSLDKDTRRVRFTFPSPPLLPVNESDASIAPGGIRNRE